MLFSMNIITLVVILIALLFLQVFLAKRENKWYGLILPSLSFIIAAVIGIGRIAYDFQTTFEVIFSDILAFLYFNIPTFIFLFIYFACRENIKKNREIEKMNIQDL